MAKKFGLFLILALVLLSTAQTRLLSTTALQQADDHDHVPSTPSFPSSSPEKVPSLSDGDDDDEYCKLGLDGEECLIRRSLAAHTDYIYTQENDAP